MGKADANYRKIRQLTREREQILDEKTVIKNQIHAENSEAFPSEAAKKRFQERLELLQKQEKEIMNEINSIVESQPEIKEKVGYITSIPGFGFLSAVIILGETNGFELIRNKKQLVSFAGLDVKEKQSGSSVKCKSKISKRGNKYLRKAMYFPAFTAIKHNENFKNIHLRLVTKHGISKKAAVAVQRKMLELSWVLVNTKTKFDKEYEIKKNRAEQINVVAL